MQSAASCAEYYFEGAVVAMARIVRDEALHLAPCVRAPIEERSHAVRTLSAPSLIPVWNPKRGASRDAWGPRQAYYRLETTRCPALTEHAPAADAIAIGD
jgi:hypothetical protein